MLNVSEETTEETDKASGSSSKCAFIFEYIYF